MPHRPVSILCIASFFKGEAFIQQAKLEGCTVYLITSLQLQQADWPHESIDEIFFVNDINGEKGNWNMRDIKNGLAYIMRSRHIDKIVSLDDFDVEKGAELREHFRIPGMGVTTSRYFRDKLAMRVKALEENIKVPAFISLFNDEVINNYFETVSPPWLIKPRGEASATGIKKLHNAHDAWEIIHSLGDNRHQYLIEQFRPGDVFHADSINAGGKVVFCSVSKYLSTPMPSKTIIDIVGDNLLNFDYYFFRLKRNFFCPKDLNFILSLWKFVNKKEIRKKMLNIFCWSL